MTDEDETDEDHDDESGDNDNDNEIELYRCDTCGKWYLTKRQLRAHSHVHKGEE